MRFACIQKVLLIITVGGMASCVTGSYPQNAQEFKDIYGKTSRMAKDTYIVNKSIDTVSSVLRRQAKKCLSKKVIIKGGYSKGVYGYTKMPDRVMTYRAYIRHGKPKFGLDLKYTISGSIFLGTNKPKDGMMYYLVADAYSVGKNKTRIEVYRVTTPKGLTIISKALKNWAYGKNYRCPDLVKVASPF